MGGPSIQSLLDKGYKMPMLYRNRSGMRTKLQRLAKIVKQHRALVAAGQTTESATSIMDSARGAKKAINWADDL